MPQHLLRHGAGRVVAALRALGVTELFTEASEVARPFFERQGYVVVEREVVRRAGVALPRYRMRKR
ncbi:MAG: hypothetical protein KAI24_02010 [Planctomycetes bacterium]|nr:hypothetical protein [Planctomycetota bacterium]